MSYLLIILLSLLVSLLLLPVGIELDASDRGRRWYIVWLGLSIPVPRWVKRLAFGAKEKGKEETEFVREREERRVQKPSLLGRAGDLIDGMRDGLEFFYRGIDLLKSVSPHIRIRVKRLDVTVATPNPALTGILCGMAYAFAGSVAPSWPFYAVPDFTRTTPEVSFRVQATVTVAKIIPAALRFKRFVSRIKAERKEIAEESNS